MHRDIGTSGHWNPECTGRGTGTDPRTDKGHRPKGRPYLVQVPLGITGGLSAARFLADSLMEVTTSWLGACWFQVRISFSEMFLKRGTSFRELVGIRVATERLGRNTQEESLVTTQAMKKNVWQMLRSSPYLQRSLV